MRALGLVLCMLLLAGCRPESLDPSRQTKKPGPQAVALLGDVRTLDYCSLLDPAGGTSQASFDSCEVLRDRLRLHVGMEGSALPESTRKAYDFPVELPAGVRVVQSTSPMIVSCDRWVGFSDDVWILTAVAENGYPATLADEELCAAADELVTGVVAAVRDARVGHVTYAAGSYGALDACELLGGSSARPGPSEHECQLSTVNLSFTAGPPDTRGTPETVAGRAVRVEKAGPICFIRTERPSADRPGIVERASLSAYVEDDSDACLAARAEAERVLAKLPR